MRALAGSQSGSSRRHITSPGCRYAPCALSGSMPNPARCLTTQHPHQHSLRCSVVKCHPQSIPHGARRFHSMAPSCVASNACVGASLLKILTPSYHALSALPLQLQTAGGPHPSTRIARCNSAAPAGVRSWSRFHTQPVVQLSKMQPVARCVMVAHCDSCCRRLRRVDEPFAFDTERSLECHLALP
jgi:hypothetical protein